MTTYPLEKAKDSKVFRITLIMRGMKDATLDRQLDMARRNRDRMQRIVDTDYDNIAKAVEMKKRDPATASDMLISYSFELGYDFDMLNEWCEIVRALTVEKNQGGV